MPAGEPPGRIGLEVPQAVLDLVWIGEPVLYQAIWGEAGACECERLPNWRFAWRDGDHGPWRECGRCRRRRPSDLELHGDAIVPSEIKNYVGINSQWPVSFREDGPNKPSRGVGVEGGIVMIFLIGVGETLVYKAVGCETRACESELLSDVALHWIDSYR